jgi:hypothetical protein
VTGGIRTHDHRDHNPGLYLLSYGHRARASIATSSRCFTAGLPSSYITGGGPLPDGETLPPSTNYYWENSVRTLRKRTFGIAAVGLAVALLVGSAVAVAGPGKKGKGLVRGVHTEISLIRADGTTDAFVVDRGKVTAESSSSVTLERKDGKSVTLGVNADTKVRGDIQVDKGAVVFSRSGTAFAVLAPRGAQAAPLRLGDGKGKGLGQRMARLKARKGLFGAAHADVSFIRADGSSDAFTFDRGQVTAASETSVTLKRADGPSVTKSISADTKLRGKLAVGGKAAVFSKGSAATAILAFAPKV